MTETPTPTSAAALAARYETTYTRELSPGVVVELKKLPLSDSILLGKLPNEVLRHIRFDGTDAYDTRDEGLVEAERFAAYEAILSRGMVRPKYKHSKAGAPDAAKDEIGPAHLSHVEMANAYYYIVKEVASPVADAPFSGPEPDSRRSSGSGESGAPVPQEPE